MSKSCHLIVRFDIRDQQSGGIVYLYEAGSSESALSLSAVAIVGNGKSAMNAQLSLPSS
jgi:hypothetical protein